MSDLREFQDALLVRNIVAKTVRAMEHSSPEEMKKYLHDHPNADPKDHKVAKPGGGGKGESTGKPSPADAKKALKSSIEGEKSKAKMNRLRDQFDRMTSYKHNDPAKAKEVSAKLTEEGKKHLSNAEESLKHIESFPGKVDERDVKELKSMIKEMRASIDRHEDSASKHDNHGWVKDISDDGDRLQHALTTALHPLRSAG